MNNWMPIETAPKDGTKILAAELLLGTIWIMEVCRFFEGEWILSWDNGDIYPSHWMPLPKPPNNDLDRWRLHVAEVTGEQG